MFRRKIFETLDRYESEKTAREKVSHNQDMAHRDLTPRLTTRLRGFLLVRFASS